MDKTGHWCRRPPHTHSATTRATAANARIAITYVYVSETHEMSDARSIELIMMGVEGGSGCVYAHKQTTNVSAVRLKSARIVGQPKQVPAISTAEQTERMDRPSSV